MDKFFDNLAIGSTLEGCGYKVDTSLYLTKSATSSIDINANEIYLSRKPAIGDTIVDIVEVKLCGDRITSYSHMQRDGFEVVIGGRASGWGSMGDDTYTDGDEIELFKQLLIEALFDSAYWRLARIYYSCKKDERGISPCSFNEVKLTLDKIPNCKTKDWLLAIAALGEKELNGRTIEDYLRETCV